jgi:hypothetical protein
VDSFTTHQGRVTCYNVTMSGNRNKQKTPNKPAHITAISAPGGVNTGSSIGQDPYSARPPLYSPLIYIINLYHYLYTAHSTQHTAHSTQHLLLHSVQKLHIVYLTLAGIVSPPRLESVGEEQSGAGVRGEPRFHVSAIRAVI